MKFQHIIIGPSEYYLLLPQRRFLGNRPGMLRHQNIVKESYRMEESVKIVSFSERYVFDFMEIYNCCRDFH